MVGQWTVTKPSRSDEVLDANEQLKIADQIRTQFDSLAPKRPLKPNRSEPDPDASDVPNPVDSAAIIPELHKFQSLQSQSHVCKSISIRISFIFYFVIYLYFPLPSNCAGYNFRRGIQRRGR